MRNDIVWLIAGCVLAANSTFVVAARPSPAKVDPNQVQYGPPPPWAAPSPAGTATETPAGAPFRVIYSDSQIAVMADHVERHVAFRAKLLNAQALTLGALQLEWNPSSQTMTVNTVRIYRDGSPIDVLTTSRFSVMQREANLEASMLTGMLTASLQVPGLRVGDEVEFAYTTSDRDITLGNRAYGANLLLAEGAGANRLKLSWAPGKVVHYQNSPDMPAPVADGSSATWQFDDPKPVKLIEGAPPRFNVRRLIEYSDFAGWKDVSAAVAPLFDKASTLASGSAVAAEADRIASQSEDPLLRAGAALKFVQEQIRYVYVGLDGANYRPMEIETTWANRFGDCKAKSVMLLAMLKRMGISSEIVLVNSQGGDGIWERVPSPLMFDHAVVRAQIGGRNYYLDSTQAGNRVLSLLEPTRYRTALPLRSGGADLERPPATPAVRPELIRTIDLDLTAGVTKPGKVTANRYIMGDTAPLFNAQLSALPTDQRDRSLRAYWAAQDGWIEPEKVSWRYDDGNRPVSRA
ncbi:MAG: DUF3857 domain-containing protein, partial [Proteobacteria bacterium]|nr:DUF3857 domain-containing protein [Pseudomonadota bacterium]